MRKFLVMLALGLGVAFSANAQKKGEKLSVKERVAKKVEKLTAELNLSKTQAEQITPIVKERILEKQEMKKKRKAFKEEGKEPTKEQKAAFKEKKAERKQYYKAKMGSVLNADQMAKLKELKKEGKKKKGKGKKKKGKKGDKICCDGDKKSCDGEKAKACHGEK